jgi:hypothetical protein
MYEKLPTNLSIQASKCMFYNYTFRLIKQVILKWILFTGSTILYELLHILIGHNI